MDEGEREATGREVNSVCFGLGYRHVLPPVEVARDLS